MIKEKSILEIQQKSIPAENRRKKEQVQKRSNRRVK